MSRLFLARDATLDRQVVVKVLPLDLVNDASLGRFRREIELTVRLQHPHILPVLSAGSVEDVHYYVTPFVPGESLRERIATEGALPLPDVRRILTQTLEALEFAHTRDIVHRDIKPGNILLLEGNVVLADFGIARAMSGDETYTHTQTAPGTPAYMAPEQPRDATADLYALGVVCYEMLTGERPTTEVSTRVLRRRRNRPDVDSAEFATLASIVVRMLALEPSRRFPSAAEVLEALAAAATRRWRASRVAIVGTLTAVVLAVGAWTVRVYENSSSRALALANDALRQGDLSSAISHARRASSLEPGDLDAQLLLARVIIYAALDSLNDEAIGALRGVLSRPRELSRRDSLRAEGWLSLLRGNAWSACSVFAKDSAANPHDFDALFGLGECRRRDRAVIVDTAHGGTLVFRGSYHGAASAYEASLTAAAGDSREFVYERLRQVLFTETNRLRSGADASGKLFMGYPAISGDTIAFGPQPLLPGGIVPVPPTRARALEQATMRLRRAYAEWVRAAPRSVVAHRYLSEVLEAVGNVTEAGTEEVTALGEIRRARVLARDTVPLLVCIEVRQLLRAGQFEAARRLADSALRRWPEATHARGAPMAGLAAITGRVSLVVGYARDLSASPRYMPALRGKPLTLPAELRHVRSDLTALASMGVCDERVRQLAARLVRWTTVDYPDYAKDADAQLAVLERPLALALSCVGTELSRSIDGSRDPLVVLKRALEPTGGSNRAEILHLLNAAHSFERPGDLTPDYVIGEAELVLRARDTVAAYERLERAIAALPSIASGAMLQVPSAAGIVRSLALGARLGAATGNAATARAWALSVVALWDGADRELQPVVAEMRRIVAGSPRGATER